MALRECSKCGASVRDGDHYCTVCKKPITTEQSEEKPKKERKKKLARKGVLMIIFWIVAILIAFAFVIVGVRVVIELIGLIQGTMV